MIGTMWRRLTMWMRKVGLAPFGFAQEALHAHHQLLRVWGLLLPARWEVYRWPVGTGSSDLDDHLKPLPRGSPEAWHRIQFSADRVYCGHDWDAAKRAMAGMYPDGTTDATRPQVGGEDERCPRCRRMDCSPECIAQEQAEIDANRGLSPEKFA